MILRVYIPCLLVLYACVGVTITLPIEQCRQTYTTSTGRTCRYCTPGTHKLGDCLQDNGSALCLTCNANEYQGYCNIAESCATCDPGCLTPFTVKVNECTLYENILCECMEGRYWHKESDFDDLCLVHDPCGVGMGMVKLGNRYNNTQCARCVYGETYSAEKSFERCQTCTRCNQYESNCTDTSDAVCLSPWQSTSPPIPTSAPPLDESSTKAEINVAEVVLTGLVILLILVIIVMACRFLRCCRKIRKYIIRSRRETKNSDYQVVASDQPKEEDKRQPQTDTRQPSDDGPEEDNKTNPTSQAPREEEIPQPQIETHHPSDEESDEDNETKPTSPTASSNADQDETSTDVLSHEADKRGIAETNYMSDIRDADGEYSLRTKNNNNTRNIDAGLTKKTPTSKDPQI